ncbi:uncharacterized protein AB9W97_007742 isoform 1-T2 [Spinachia spinachia]
MPKEQQQGSCAASSKNAKNKRNRTTLLAMRDAGDEDVGGGTSFRCSSEKDSGYSDGQQTDVEDQEKSQRRAEPARTGRNQGLRRGNPGKWSPTAAGRQPPPIYIINNIVVQQNRDERPQRSVGMEDGGSGAARVILAPAPRQLHEFFPSSIVTGREINGTYPPTNPSRPHIASRTAPDKSPSSDGSQNLTKKVREAEDTHGPLGRHRYARPRSAASPRPSSSSPTTGPSSQSTPPSSVLKTRGAHGNASTKTRHFRFLNTAEILRQSGLLDVALRTKELLRQSNATARDVAELRRHTELLCRAVSDPGATPEQLHRAMAESGSYPGVEVLRNFQIPDSSDSEVPSTRLLEARGRPAERDRFTPPDSSTG